MIQSRTDLGLVPAIPITYCEGFAALCATYIVFIATAGPIGCITTDGPHTTFQAPIVPAALLSPVEISSSVAWSGSFPVTLNDRPANAPTAKMACCAGVMIGSTCDMNAPCDEKNK